MSTRKEFEAFVTTSKMLASVRDPDVLGRHENGDYFYNAIQTAWLSWKAAVSMFRRHSYIVHPAMSEDYVVRYEPTGV
mgnify:FL=1